MFPANLPPAIKPTAEPASSMLTPRSVTYICGIAISQSPFRTTGVGDSHMCRALGGANRNKNVP